MLIPQPQRDHVFIARFTIQAALSLIKLFPNHLGMASTESIPKPPFARAVNGSSTDPVALRIGTGGAGESGLLQALAEAFIASSVTSRVNKLKIR